MGPNERLVRRWFDEVWNARQESTIDALYAKDGLVHGLGDPLRGPAAFKAFWRGFLAGFDDVKVTVDHAIEAGDWVAFRATARLTRAGRQHVLRGGSHVRVEGGMIAEAHDSWDFLGVLTELGHVAPDVMTRLVTR